MKSNCKRSNVALFSESLDGFPPYKAKRRGEKATLSQMLPPLAYLSGRIHLKGG